MQYSHHLIGPAQIAEEIVDKGDVHCQSSVPPLRVRHRWNRANRLPQPAQAVARPAQVHDAQQTWWQIHHQMQEHPIAERQILFDTKQGQRKHAQVVKDTNAARRRWQPHTDLQYYQQQQRCDQWNVDAQAPQKKLVQQHGHGPDEY